MSTPRIDLNNTVGALEIGVLVSTCLFGVTSCQVWFYCRKFPRDDIVLKLMVAVIWVLELCHTIAVSHSLYTMTIIDVDNPLKFISPPKSLDASILFSAFIGPLVQAWFAYRVLRLSGKLYIPVLCWFLSFVRCVATVAVGVEALLSASVHNFEMRLKWLLTFILAIGAAVDVIIAGSLCYFFRRLRATSFKKTVKVINQTMVWTIETGLLTSVAAVAMLICFLVMQGNFVWVAIFTFLAKLFSNAFLVALNSRNVKCDQLPEHRSSTFLDALPSTVNINSPIQSQDRKTTVSQSFDPPGFPEIAIEMLHSTEVRTEVSAEQWHYAV